MAAKATAKPEAKAKLKAAAKTETVSRFTKTEILGADRYKHRVDLINALLDEAETYTLSEVDSAIENYMKGKVM